MRHFSMFIVDNASFVNVHCGQYVIFHRGQCVISACSLWTVRNFSMFIMGTAQFLHVHCGQCVISH